jgi:hypothetical protein
MENGIIFHYSTHAVILNDHMEVKSGTKDQKFGIIYFHLCGTPWLSKTLIIKVLENAIVFKLL